MNTIKRCRLILPAPLCLKGCFYMKKYAIGIDFGTLSARAVIIDRDGRQYAEHTCSYPHGVLESTLPDGTPLGANWALQVPDDYLHCLVEVVQGCMAQSGFAPESMEGIGIDFTSCSVMPTTREGIPLCNLPDYQQNPHAYPKLWKHHAAQYCADTLNQIARDRKEAWLPLYGGNISSEWVIPKAMQIAMEAPEIYAAMDRFIECGDWIVWQLCGREARSVCNAGYKAQWMGENGYPSRASFKALHPGMEFFAEEKLSADIFPLGSAAGYLTPAMAKRLGLTTDVAVAVGIIDAHSSVLACGIAEAGSMLMAIGTSTCHLMLSEKQQPVAGISGVVQDGILPGFFAYEAGQSCVGDHFQWFVQQCTPQEYVIEAQKKGVNLHQLLSEKAAAKAPGESGLLALDWWNGVRSTLMDSDLSGVLVGMTLATRPEDIYRALIEATAYGTRHIIDTFQRQGVPVHKLYAGGGIAQKNPMLMQIYADVTGYPITVVASGQSGAVGAAILGVAAANPALGLRELVQRIGKPGEKVYAPIPDNHRVYTQLYTEYMCLHNYFGTGGNDVLHRLKAIQTDQNKD